MTEQPDHRHDRRAVNQMALDRAQAAIPAWRGLSVDDFDFDDPKGFSSFTMGVRARVEVEPPAVLYRHLDGKENAILDSADERRVFLSLGDAGIAPRCLAYEPSHRLEEFYAGRTLTADDVFDPEIQRRVAEQLHRLHQHDPGPLPEATYFELLHDKWATLGRPVLTEHRGELLPDEAALCGDLLALYEPDTLAEVMRCLPDREPVFCHNDTYHGNVFLRDDGTVRLLDFEFSCRNHIAFDFANFFAETVMLHGFEEPPHFKIGTPRFTDADLRQMIGFYVDCGAPRDASTRTTEIERLVAETRRAILLSDVMYAMAAIPLALQPMQRIRFIPYAHQRFHRFLAAWDREFDTT